MTITPEQMIEWLEIILDRIPQPKDGWINTDRTNLTAILSHIRRTTDPKWKLVPVEHISKTYAGTYIQYIGRIVERIMQESMIAREEERTLDIDGFLLDDTWDRIKKFGTDEIMKAVKAAPTPGD